MTQTSTSRHPAGRVAAVQDSQQQNWILGSNAMRLPQDDGRAL